MGLWSTLCLWGEPCQQPCHCNNLYQAGDRHDADITLGLPGPQTLPRTLASKAQSDLPCPAQPSNEPCILTRSDQPTEVTESPSTERSQSRVTWGKEGAVCVS